MDYTGMGASEIREAYAALSSGHPLEALAAVRNVPEYSQHSVMARTVEGVAYLQIGRPWRALSRLSAVVTETQHPEAASLNLALAHLHLNDSAGALEALNNAGPAAGRLPQYWEILSGALIRAGRFEESLQATERGRSSGNDTAHLFVNRTTALIQLGREREALEFGEEALRKYPSEKGLKINVSLALAGLDRTRDAIELAIASQSADAVRSVFDILCAKVSALTDSATNETATPHRIVDLVDGLVGRPALLEVLAERLLLANLPEIALYVCGYLAGNRPETTALRARALAMTGRLDDAEATLRSGFGPAGPPAGLFTGTFFGSDPRVDALTLFVENEVTALLNGQWARYTERTQAIIALTEGCLNEGRRAPLNPFFALSLPMSAGLQRRIAASFAREHASRCQPVVRNNDVGEHGKLHLGYLSADFRNHPTAHLIHRMFGLHNRERFRVTAYALKPGDDSPYHRNIVRETDAFVELNTLDDEAAAVRIAGDGVHILIDLMGYTKHARPGIFARRPAPLQVNFLGMFGSIGADYIDYLVADQVVIPLEHRAHYHEPAILLPVSCQVADSKAPIRTAAVPRQDEDLPEEGFVYCSFNDERKLTPDLFDSWARILSAVPDSVLWLMRPQDENAANRLREEMESRDVNPERLVFAERTLKARHLRRMGLADLFLDSFVFNAATTAVDSLLAGLPLLTLRGTTFQSRIASSILIDAGLPELVTDSREDYERLAIHLGKTPTRLREIHSRLADARRTGRLLDTERFTRHLEHGLELAWQRAVSDLPPDWIEVPPTDTRSDTGGGG